MSLGAYSGGGDGGKQERERERERKEDKGNDRKHRKINEKSQEMELSLHSEKKSEIDFDWKSKRKRGTTHGIGTQREVIAGTTESVNNIVVACIQMSQLLQLLQGDGGDSEYLPCLVLEELAHAIEQHYLLTVLNY